jgi:bacterioferritin
MKGDKQVLEQLNIALRHELTAVNQYWLHYRLLEDWGYTKLAKQQRHESIEEMKHADEIVSRIIFLEGHPNMQELDPLSIGQNVKEVLDADLKAEYHARDLYMTARDVCRTKEDYTTMRLFEHLIEDEEEHIDWLETQLSLLGDIGDKHYGHLQAAAADESD